MIKDSDIRTIGRMVRVVKGMRPELRDETLRQLVMINPEPGNARIVVGSQDEWVRIDFERPLAWLKISRQDALHLGMLLLEHGGAQIGAQDAPASGAPPSAV